MTDPRSADPTPPAPRRLPEACGRPPLLRRLRRTPALPAVATYQGRPLDRPDEDVEDQGLAFDLGTLHRRQVLRGLGLGAVGLGLAACGTTAASTGSSTSSAAGSSGEIPDETAGPYPGDGSNGPDVLEQSGIVRSDLTSSFAGATGTATGVPMELSLTITDIAGGGVPFAGAAVYVWHCDAQGRYSLYSDGVTEENYLRGVQVADADGVVRFTSVVPACYTGRWPHVHLEVYPDVGSITDVGNAVATSQVALPQATCDAVYAEGGYEGSAANLAQVSLTSDTVFGDDAGASQLAAVSGDVGSGYAVSLPVGVDTTTEPTGGGMPGGSDGPAGGRGGPPPGGQGGAPGGAPGDAPTGAPTGAAS